MAQSIQCPSVIARTQVLGERKRERVKERNQSGNSSSKTTEEEVLVAEKDKESEL